MILFYFCDTVDLLQVTRSDSPTVSQINVMDGSFEQKTCIICSKSVLNFDYCTSVLPLFCAIMYDISVIFKMEIVHGNIRTLCRVTA